MFKRKSNKFKALFFLSACLPITVAIGVGSYFLVNRTTKKDLNNNIEDTKQNRVLSEEEFNAIELNQISVSFADKKILSKETAQYFYNGRNLDQIKIEILGEFDNYSNLSLPKKTVLNPNVPQELDLIHQEFGKDAIIDGSNLFLAIEYTLDIDEPEVEQARLLKTKSRTFYISISNFLNNAEKETFVQLAALAEDAKSKFQNNTSLFPSIFNYNYSINATDPQPDSSDNTLINGNIEIKYLKANKALNLFFADSVQRLKSNYASVILGAQANSYNFEFLPYDSQSNNYSVNTATGIIYAPFRIFEKTSTSLRNEPVQIEDTIQFKFLSDSEDREFNKLQKAKNILNDTQKLSLNNSSFIFRINSIIQKQGITFASDIANLEQTLNNIVINDASTQESINVDLKIKPTSDPNLKPNNKEGIIHVVFEISSSKNGEEFKLEFPFEITHRIFSGLADQDSIFKYISDSVNRFVSINPDFKGQSYELLPSRLYKWGKTTPLANLDTYTSEVQNLAQSFIEDPNQAAKQYFKKFFNFSIPTEGYNFLVPTTEAIMAPSSSVDNSVSNETKFQILFIGFEDPYNSSIPSFANDAIIEFPEKKASIVAKFAITYGNSMKVISLNLNQSHGVKSTDDIFKSLQDSLASNSATGEISYIGAGDIKTTNVNTLSLSDFSISNLSPDPSNPSNINNCQYIILDIKDRNENEGWIDINYYVEWKNPKTNEVLATSKNKPSVKRISGFFQEPTPENKLSDVIKIFAADPKKYMKIDNGATQPADVYPSELRKERISFDPIPGADNVNVSFEVQTIVLAFDENGFVKLKILASGYGISSASEYDFPWFKSLKSNVLDKYVVNFANFPNLTPDEFKAKYSNNVIDAVATMIDNNNQIVRPYELANYKIIPSNWVLDGNQGTVAFDYAISLTTDNSTTTTTKHAVLSGLLSTNQQQLNKAVINQKPVTNPQDFSNKDVVYYYSNPAEIKNLIKSITIGTSEVAYDPANSDYEFLDFKVSPNHVNEATGKFSFSVLIKNKTQNMVSQRILTEFTVINKMQSVVNKEAAEYTKNPESAPIVIINNNPSLTIDKLKLSDFSLQARDEDFIFSLDKMQADTAANSIKFTIKIQKNIGSASTEFSTFDYTYSLTKTKGIIN